MSELTKFAAKHPHTYNNKDWRLTHLYKVENKQSQIVTFKPNFFQDRFYDERTNRSIIVKGRRRGATFGVGYDIFDDCFWNDNFTAYIIGPSRDKTTEIFKFILLIYERLNPLLQQANPRIDRDSHSKIVFENGSSINVSTTTRGNKANYILITEYGIISVDYPKNAKEIVSSLESVEPDSKVVIESTTKDSGPTGDFYERVQTATKSDSAISQGLKDRGPFDYKLHTFYWWEDPDILKEFDNLENLKVDLSQYEEYFQELEDLFKIKVSEIHKKWYVLKAEETKEGMLNEYPSTVDEAFSTTAIGRIYAKQMKIAQREERIGDAYPYDPNLPVYVSFDLGYGDEMAMGFFQLQGANISFIRYFSYTEETVLEALRILQVFADEHGYKYETLILPTDASQHHHSSVSGTTKEIFEEKGYTVYVLEELFKVKVAINITKNMFDKFTFYEQDCKVQINHLLSYRWKVKPNSDGLLSDTPDHKIHSHACDTVRHAACSYERFLKFRMPDSASKRRKRVLPPRRRRIA